jgi:hypothetical protein
LRRPRRELSEHVARGPTMSRARSRTGRCMALGLCTFARGWRCSPLELEVEGRAAHAPVRRRRRPAGRSGDPSVVSSHVDSHKQLPPGAGGGRRD